MLLRHFFIASGPARGEEDDLELEIFLDGPPFVPRVPRCESGGVLPVAVSRLLEATPAWPPAAR